MVTIPDAVKAIIIEQPFLEDALAKGFINLSALARYIKPKIEQKLYKSVEVGAIVMALKRLVPTLQTNNSLVEQFASIPDILVRLNLTEVAVRNSQTLPSQYKEILTVAERKQAFIALTQGVYEATLIASRELLPDITAHLKHEQIIATYPNIASITMKLPHDTVETPGVYYQILKVLAWHGLNFVEIISSYTEVTIIFEEKDLDTAFTLLKQSFASQT